MRVALWDVARAQAERLRPNLAATDEFVEVPTAPAKPVEVDVVIASRFNGQDRDRARFRLLQVPGAGTDKIDLDAVLPEAFICNAYEHEQPIAEYIFAALLDYAVGFGGLTRSIPEKGWGGAYFSRIPHGELAGKTLGLVGLGHIGAAAARRGKAFDMKVLAVTGSGRGENPDVDWLGKADRLGELLAQSDFVVLACPLNDATRGMMGAEQFRRMKPTALLVNVARAEVAVEEDLFGALKAGTIGGAVLDPWYRYPSSATDPVTPSRFPFESLQNVRMTPHSAGWTDGVWHRRCAFFGENIRRLAVGAPLLNVVRAPAAGHRSD